MTTPATPASSVSTPTPSPAVDTSRARGVRAKPTRADSKDAGPLQLIGFSIVEDVKAAAQPSPVFRRGNDIIFNGDRVDPVSFARSVAEGLVVLFAEAVQDVSTDVGLLLLRDDSNSLKPHVRRLWRAEDLCVVFLSDIHPDLSTKEDAYVAVTLLNALAPSKS